MSFLVSLILECLEQQETNQRCKRFEMVVGPTQNTTFLG